MQKTIIKLLLLILTGLGVRNGFSQTPKMQLEVVERGVSSNLRGLSSRDGKTIWVSGSNGMYAISKDGGKSWAWQCPLGYHHRDFRDIQDLGGGAAVMLGIDTPAVILKTSDGGIHWKKVYTNNQPGMFLDAMDFTNTRNGIVVGDPIEGQIFMARTKDGAESWQPFKPDFKCSIDTGEAFFAASGTNIHLQNKNEFILISGGTQSRLWKTGHTPALLPFQQGTATAGPNGMDVKGNTIAIVGGDFTKPDEGDNCYAISYDGGNRWQPAHKLPGYGSGVAIISDSLLVACGLGGVWVTRDGGKNWETIDTRPFNALLYIPGTKKLFLVGQNGMIAVIKGL